MPPRASYTQANRPLKVFTKLEPDALLPVGLEGREAVSELFRFQIDLIAEKDRDIPFEKLVGAEAHVEVTLAEGGARYFHGIITELSEGATDATFTQYQAILAPALWRLTKRFRFRIFQEKSVVEILATVLHGLEVRFRTTGEYRPRNFTVQYYETDFAFASRLMEQEGIFYHFEHRADGHVMVLADQSSLQADIAAPSEVKFDAAIEGAKRTNVRVTAWRKTQQMCSGKFTYWDYNFQMPENHLEASCTIHDQVPVGTVAHHLTAGGNSDLEVFQLTGEYGGLYDGIDPSGTARPQSLQHLFEENRKFARQRMEQEASQGLRVEGASTCGRFVPGVHFSLVGHDRADGAYFLASVSHWVRQTGYRADEKVANEYCNEFVAAPKELPFRPARVTPWPRAQGLQPAVVVGPKGEEIFTDKYGRVKVQFLWDREGKHDADSSCWIRVAQHHAGMGFGSVSLPRVGEEVIVGFEGDNPDRPLIVGRVYNAHNEPPFELPKHRTRTVHKSHSQGGNSEQYSGLTIEDQSGQEKVQLHAQKDMVLSTEATKTETVGADHHENISGNHKSTVNGDRLERIGGTHLNIVGGPWGQNPEQSITPENFLWPASSPDGSGQGGGTENMILSTTGSNISVTFGFSSVIGAGITINGNIGPAYAICIDPIGYLSGLGEDATRLAKWGGGTAATFGGTYLLTLGSATNVIFGPVFTRIGVDKDKANFVSGLISELHPIERILTIIESLLAIGSTIGLGEYAHDHPDNFASSKTAEILFSLNLTVLAVIALVEGILLKTSQLGATVAAKDGNLFALFAAIRT